MITSKLVFYFRNCTEPNACCVVEKMQLSNNRYSYSYYENIMTNYINMFNQLLTVSVKWFSYGCFKWFISVK